MSIKKSYFILISVCVFLGVLLAGQFVGLWQLKNHEISGETLLIEVANTYNIPLEVIYETWNIPNDLSPRSSLEDAKDIAEFSMGRFRIWVTAFVENTAIPPTNSQAVSEHNPTESNILITGATSIVQAMEMYNTSIDDFYEHFSLPNTLSKNTPLRELRETFGISMEEIKAWVASNRK